MYAYVSMELCFTVLFTQISRRSPVGLNLQSSDSSRLFNLISNPKYISFFSPPVCSDQCSLFQLPSVW